MRQYFSELSIGQAVSMSVIFNSASPRQTRAMKPYLVLELFDGREKLVGNYWDWAGKAIPNVKDTVYKIAGVVTEYNGQKQVTVQSINTDNETQVTDFMPSSGLDMLNMYQDAWQFATDNIIDNMLRDLTLNVLEAYKDLWLAIPAATGIHHAFVGGNLIHSLSVARIALAIAREIPEAHADIVVVGALLHDLGKLQAYGIDGVTMCMTTRGKMFEHAKMGVDMLDTIIATAITPLCENDLMKLDIVRHIILSHHGSLEYGAVIEPQCIEAHIVNRADGIDAAAQMIREASNKTEEFWTDKIWGLNNRQMINYKHIKALLPMTFDDEALPEK